METVLRFLFLATLVCSGKIIVSSVRLKSSRKSNGSEPEVDVKVVYACRVPIFFASCEVSPQSLKKFRKNHATLIEF